MRHQINPSYNGPERIKRVQGNKARERKERDRQRKIRERESKGREEEKRWKKGRKE